MKTDVEKLDPTRVKLSVEVPFAELAPSLTKAYKTIGGQVRVPGFRPGKVPARIIDARVGRDAVLQEALNDAIPQLYGQAVTESGIRAIGQPEVDITEIQDGDQIRFTAEVDVRPDFDLPSRDDLEVTIDPLNVTDAEVDEQVESLRERFAAQTPVDRPAEAGDVVTIDLRATRDGESIEGGEATGQTYRIGSGSMLDGLDDAVLGLSAGESATFSTTLVGPEAGEPADVEVNVQAVKRQELPELDDEFAQLASEFDTVDQMRDDIRTRLTRAKRSEQLVAARDLVLDAYLERVDVPIPTRMLEHELEHRNEAIAEELRSYGLSMEQYLRAQSTTAEEFEQDNRDRAVAAIKAQFVLEALAAQDELGVEEGELTAHLVNRAQRAGMSPDQFVQQVLQSGNVQGLVGEVVRGKALAQLVRGARVVDTEGSEIDILALEAELSGQQTEQMSADEGEEDVDEQAPVTGPYEPVDESISFDIPFVPDAEDSGQRSQ